MWLLNSSKPDLDSRLAYPRPRPRPRLSSFKIKTKTKTFMSKTKTETQDLQDQYWKSMTEMDCDKQKDWKVMASRKSSILHSKQQDIIPCLTTVLFPQLPLMIAVYQTLARTHTSITKALMSKCFWSGPQICKNYLGYEKFPRVYIRAKRYCSFIQYALSHYQDRVQNN